MITLPEPYHRFSVHLKQLHVALKKFLVKKDKLEHRLQTTYGAPESLGGPKRLLTERSAQMHLPSRFVPLRVKECTSMLRGRATPTS